MVRPNELHRQPQCAAREPHGLHPLVRLEERPRERQACAPHRRVRGTQQRLHRRERCAALLDGLGHFVQVYERRA